MKLKNYCKIIFFTLFIFSIFDRNAFAINQYLLNSTDFLKHIKLHSIRVSLLMEYLATQFPEEFEHIPVSLVKEYAKYHDAEKLFPNNFNGLFQTLGIAYRKPEQTEEEIKRLADLGDFKFKTYQSVSQDGKLSRTEFFLDHKLMHSDGNHSQYIDILIRIEHIADCVDRGMDPVAIEEIGRPLTLASQDEKYLKNSRDRELAAFVEFYYKVIIKGFAFVDYQQEDLKFHFPENMRTKFLFQSICINQGTPFMRLF